jgi:hypothetical protein
MPDAVEFVSSRLAQFHLLPGPALVTCRGIKIPSLGVSCGKGIDRVLVLPLGDATSSLSVFYCLLAIAKRWIRASCLKPCALFQRSAQSDTPRVNRDEIIKIFSASAYFPRCALMVARRSEASTNPGYCRSASLQSAIAS